MFSGVTSHARRLAELALADTAVIERAAWASDGEGGQTATWATHATVPAMLSGVGSADEQEIGEGVRAVVSWTVSVPVGTDVVASDRVVINGKTLEVVGVIGGRTYAALARVLCSEVGDA